MCSSSTRLVCLILNFWIIVNGHDTFDIPIRNPYRPPTNTGADIWTIASANTHFDERCVSRFGIVPDPEDCGQYIVCSVNRAYRRRCPPFTLFDYNQKQCVYFSSADCYTQEKIVCPKRFGLFRHLKCDRYWACANGKARLKFCPAFKRFDVRYKQCRFSLWADCTDEAPSSPATTVTEVPPTTTVSVEQSSISTLPSSIIETKTNLSSTLENNFSIRLTTPAVSFSTNQTLISVQTTNPFDQPLDSQTLVTSEPSQTNASFKPIVESNQSSSVDSDLVLTTLEPILESSPKRLAIDKNYNKIGNSNQNTEGTDNSDGTTTNEITTETTGTITEAVITEETVATLTPLLSSSTIKESDDNEIIPSYLSSKSPSIISDELIGPEEEEEEEMESSTPCN